MWLEVDLKLAGWFIFRPFQVLGFKTPYGQLQRMIIQFKTIAAQSMQPFVCLQKVHMGIHSNGICQIPDEAMNDRWFYPLPFQSLYQNSYKLFHLLLGSHGWQAKNICPRDGDRRHGGYGKVERRRCFRCQPGSILSGKYKCHGVAVEDIKVAMEHIQSERMYIPQATGMDEDPWSTTGTPL